MNPQDKALAEVYRLILQDYPLMTIQGNCPQDESEGPAALTADPDCEEKNPAEDFQSQIDCNTPAVTDEQP